IAHPILDGDGVNIGVIVFQISDREIFRILGNYNGLGETGEAGVAQLKGDEGTLVAPTRFDPEAAFRRKARLGPSPMNGMQRASKGEHGYGPIIDYRDLPCQASYSYIPSLRWGLVVKQDQSEAFAMVTSQRRAIGGLLFATVIVVVLIAQLV